MVSLSGLATALPVESTNTIGVGRGRGGGRAARANPGTGTHNTPCSQPTTSGRDTPHEPTTGGEPEGRAPGGVPNGRPSRAKPPPWGGGGDYFHIAHNKQTPNVRWDGGKEEKIPPPPPPAQGVVGAVPRATKPGTIPRLLISGHVLCAMADPFTMNATAILAAITNDVMSRHLLDTAEMPTGPRRPRQVGHQRPFRRRTTSRSRRSIGRSDS